MKITGRFFAFLFSVPFFFLPVILRAQHLAADGNYALYLCEEGFPSVWGKNGNGRLGIASSDPTISAALQMFYGDLSGITGVFASRYASFALTKDGDVYYSGSYLGYSATVPTKLLVPGKIIAIAGVGLALREDGTVWDLWEKKQIPGLTGITAISSNPDHSLALKSDGTVWSWGLNHFAQLGDTTITERTVPAQVPGLPHMKAIAVGEFHSLALSDDGTVWGWGRNGRKQIDTSTQLIKALPTRVPLLNNITTIRSAGSIGLALKDDGTVWSWGYMDNGFNATGSPAMVAGLTNIVEIASGADYNSSEHINLALQSNGTLWSWGYGIMGNGQPAGVNKTPVKVSCTAARLNTKYITCKGKDDASITAEVKSCVAPYTFLWSNGQTTQTIKGIGPGIYSVQIKDAKGCTRVLSQDITQPKELTATYESKNACDGIANGSIAAYPNLNDVTYQWNTGASTYKIDNLTSGNYTLTITSSTGCNLTQAFNIQQSSPIVTSVGFTNNNCSYDKPTATVTATGGAAPYNYTWNGNISNGGTLTGLTPGTTYTCVVSDGNQCTNTTKVLPESKPNLIFSVTKTDVICHGENSGTATVITGDSSSALTYKWMPSGQTTAIATGLIPGSHYITITNALGCSETGSTFIYEPAETQITITKKNQCDTKLGSAATSVTGPGFPYTYLWSNGQKTSSANNLIAGTYTVTVTNSKGCSVSKTVVIEKSTAIAVSIAKQDVACYGDKTGSATALVSGGTPGYTFSWNTYPVQTSQTAIGLEEKFYSVTVTDSNGCNTSTAVQINQQQELSLSVQTGSSCNGGINGTVTVKAGGGAGGNYAYLWLPGGQTTTTVTGLAAGTYTVLVTDTSACKKEFNIIVPATLKATLTKSYICNGGYWIVDARALGGTPPYTYKWDGIWFGTGTTNSFSTKKGGTVIVTIFDANNCESTDSLKIADAPPLLTCSTSQTSESCKDIMDATATAIPMGGMPPYTYSWSNGETNATAVSLTATSYTVKVSDSNKCTAKATVKINGLDPIVLKASATSLCSGPNTGTATVSVTGGSPPYTYQWMPGGQTSANAVNLQTGTYTVDVIDSHNCLQTATANVEKGLTLTASETNLVSSSTHRGTASVTANGGIPGYRFLWNTTPIQTAATAIVIPGTYQVTVLDTVGCSAIVDVIVTETRKKSPLAGGSKHTVYICNTGVPMAWGDNSYGELGDSTFAQQTVPVTIKSLDNISLISTGNSASLFLKQDGTLWSAGKFTFSKGGILAGDPRIVKGVDNVIDMEGNYALKNDGSIWTGINDQLPVKDPYLKNIVSFTGMSRLFALKNDGTIWNGNNTPYNLHNIIALSQGELFLLALTKDGTVWQMDYASTNKLPKKIDGLTDIVSIQCGKYHSLALKSDGTVWAWGDDQFGQIGDGATVNTCNCPTKVNGLTDVVDIGAGDYHSLALKKDGTIMAWGRNIFGQLGDNTFINRDAPVIVKCSKPGIKETSLSCIQEGSATVIMASCFAPFTYAWSTVPVQTTPQITGLSAGTYTITVTDSKNCKASSTVTIKGYNPLALATTQTDALCNGNKNGTAAIVVSGGKPPYLYKWSSGDTTTKITNGAGTYKVAVTDASSCKNGKTIVISEPQPITAIINTTQPKCHGGIGSSAIHPSGGTAPYTYMWSTSPSDTSNEVNLPDGSHSVVVTDAAACTKTFEVSILSPLPLTNVPTLTNPSSCSSSDGNIFSTVSGGTSPYYYQWEGTINTTANLTNVPKGTYTLHVTDSHDCVQHFQSTLTCATDVQELKTSDLLIYPNPGNGTVTIKSEVDGVYTIINNIGQLVASLELHAGNGHTITIKKLASGVYFLAGTMKNGKIIYRKITVVE